MQFGSIRLTLHLSGSDFSDISPPSPRAGTKPRRYRQNRSRRSRCRRYDHRDRYADRNLLGSVGKFQPEPETTSSGKCNPHRRYIGYKTQTVTPGAKTFLEITLEEESALLDDVVVVGYGTARKKDLTGSLSSVNSQQIIARQQPTISSGLAGSHARRNDHPHAFRSR